MNLLAEVIVGNALQTLKNLPDASVQTVVTSPPYWGLRDYGDDEQLGLEKSPFDFIENLCKVFDEIWRVVKDDGTIWVNLGDSYYNKSLAGIPFRFAFAMQERGWFLRQDIIWHKPNVMPESVTDRCTKSHEYIFLLTKSSKYFYDNKAILEPVSEISLKRSEYGWDSDRPSTKNASMGGTGIHTEQMGTRFVNPEGRNKRSVWTVTAKGYKEAHFAVYPPELIEPCILAGSKEGDTVLDPFSGSGTTGEVALKHNRNYIGLELNPEYAEISRKRLLEAVGMFGEIVVK